MSIFPAVLPPVLFPLCRPKPLTYHPDADNFLISTWVHFFPSPRLTCLCEHSTGNSNARYAKMNPLSLQICSSSCIPSLGKWTHHPSRPSSHTPTCRPWLLPLSCTNSMSKSVGNFLSPESGLSSLYPLQSPRTGKSDYLTL